MNSVLSSNRNPFARSFAGSATLVTALVLGFFLYAWSERRIDEINAQRQHSLALMVELGQSSEDLTWLARSFVVTGEPRYRELYERIIAMRDGLAPRPVHFYGFVWDLMGPDGQLRLGEEGEAVPLLALMRRAGFTAQELSGLETAKHRSDALAEVERQAMAAARGGAIAALFDQAYLEAKMDIMRPIHAGFVSVDERTGAAVRRAEYVALVLLVAEILVGLLCLDMLRRIYGAMRGIMGGHLQDIYANIVRIGQGDFATPITVEKGREDSILGRLATIREELAAADHDRRQTHAALEESLARLRKISQRLPGVVYVFMLKPDGSMSMPYASDAVRDIFGLDPEQMRHDARIVLDFVPAEEHEPLLRSIDDSARELTPWRHEFRIMRRDGEMRWLYGNSMPEREPDGTTLWYGFITDITERKLLEDDRKRAEEEREELVNRLAFFDSLTQLPNRRLLMDRLGHALYASDRSGRHGAVCFLDLDRFKELNDSQGHETGDRLLQQVAARLQSSIRQGDTVARLGGDEFVLVLEALSGDAEEAATQALQIADKVLDALRQPYRLGELEWRCSASLGFTLFHGHADSEENLLKQADSAMYVAKRSGRDRVRRFAPAA
jgi:diguanylate cyclase (GGDEF)-like protein/PAS domain S-box-containing protein